VTGGGWARRALALAALVSLLVSAVACTPSIPGRGNRSPAPGSKGLIVVGVSGGFAENKLVAEMYARVLEHAGYTVERQFELGSREVSQTALESGQIDVKPEYLSSLLLYLDPRAEPSDDPDIVLAQDRELLSHRGIEVLTPAPAQDTNVFVTNAATAARYGLTTMSSLAPVASQLTLGGPPECPQRPFCLAGLSKTYGLLFNDFKALDAGGPQTVEALRNDEVQVGLMFSTDPTIDANGFVPLVDDLHLQDAENITPVIRSDVLNDEIRSLLDGVSAKLTSDNVTALVGKVVIDGEDLTTVAREFLRENGLL